MTDRSTSPSTRKSAARLVVTCEACRFGCHDECCGVIVISRGRCEGVHRCACTAPHASRNGIEVHTP